MTSIGDYAFYNCTAMTEINFNATSMDDLSSWNYVFAHAGQNGDGITVTIGANVTRIPAYLFYPYYAPKITSIVFEEGSECESIGVSAFRSCTSLTSIIIPNSVTSIGNSAFYNSTTLESVYYVGTADEWTTITFSNDYSDPTYYGATIYYYSESQPTDSGNYWHYVDGEVVVWTDAE